MLLPSKRVRPVFRDDRQELSEKFWRLKNSLTVGMLEAATPANISISLCKLSSPAELEKGRSSYAQRAT